MRRAVSILMPLIVLGAFSLPNLASASVPAISTTPERVVDPLPRSNDPIPCKQLLTLKMGSATQLSPSLANSEPAREAHPYMHPYMNEFYGSALTAAEPTTPQEIQPK